jgi:hypothetical protein
MTGHAVAVNRRLRLAQVISPPSEPLSFHQGLPGYRPTPVRILPDQARGLACVIFLPASAAQDRAGRIAATGAQLARVDGDYDAAVAEAAAAAPSDDAVQARLSTRDTVGM